MKYFKDNNGLVYEYYDYQIPTDGLIEISLDEFNSIVYPPKSNDELLAEEMDELNNHYDIDMLLLANEYNIAVARDASTETEKVLAARAKIDVLDAKYELDQASLIKKYNEA